MKGIYLTMNEQTKYEIVKSFVDSKSSNYKNLSLKLNSSLKTAYNLVSKYKTLGKQGFIHKNHFNKPKHTLSESLKETIINLYITLDLDINFSHFKDILKRDYDIDLSRSTIYRILRSADLYSPKSRKATIKMRDKLIKEKLKNKNKLTKHEELIVSNHLLDSFDAHPRKPRSKYFGELVQIDASQHIWFGKSKYHLHAGIDDATGRILGAFFDKEETLYGYYNLTKQILENYGIPHQILTDNRTVFNYNSNGKSSEERDTFTQYGFMCHRLGIALSTSSIPQVKGRIERLFRSLQDRLIVEMRLNKIDCIEKANEFLPLFIEQYNEQFSIPINNTIDAFEKQIDSDKINESLAIVSSRKTDNGGCIKYQNKYYNFYNKNGSMVVPIPKTECLVVKKFNNQLIAIINENAYILEKFTPVRKDSILESPSPKTKKIYKPPLSHPFKQRSYLNYLKHYRPYQQNNYSYEYL